MVDRFVAYETCHGYAFEDTVTGEIQELGDGVDAFFTESGRPITSPARIVKLFQASLNWDIGETIEAYGLPASPVESVIV